MVDRRAKDIRRDVPARKPCRSAFHRLLAVFAPICLFSLFLVSGSACGPGVRPSQAMQADAALQNLEKQALAKAGQLYAEALKSGSMTERLGGMAGALALYDQLILAHPDIARQPAFARLLDDYSGLLRTSAEDEAMPQAERQRRLTLARFVMQRQPDVGLAADGLTLVAQNQMGIGAHDDATETLTSAYQPLETLAPEQRDWRVADMAELLALDRGRRTMAMLWAAGIHNPRLRAVTTSAIAGRQLRAGDLTAPELIPFAGMDLAGLRAHGAQLMTAAGQLFGKGDWRGAVTAALAADPAVPGRDTFLLALTDRAATHEQRDDAELAAFGIARHDLQIRALYVLALRNAAAGRLTIAERLADNLAGDGKADSDGRSSANSGELAEVWSRIALGYAQSDMTQPARANMQKARSFMSRAITPAAKSRTHFNLAMADIELDDYPAALGNARKVSENASRIVVLQRIAAEGLKTSNWNVAENAIREIRKYGRLEDAVILKAELLAARRRPVVIEGLVGPQMSVATRVWVLAYAADAFAGQGNATTAAGKVAAMESLRLRAQTPADRQQSACALVFAYASTGQLDKARRDFPMAALQDDERCRQAVKQLAVGYVSSGRLDQVDELLRLARDDKQRSQVLPRVVDILTEGGNFELAAAYAKQIPSYKARVAAMHSLAMASAKALDSYQVLDGERLRPGLWNGEPEVIMQSTSFVFYGIANRTAGEALPSPPRLDRYDRRRAGAAIPVAGPGRAYVIPMQYDDYNSKFISQVNNVFRDIGERAFPVQAQGTRYPRYINVDSGVFTLESLSRQLAETGHGDLLVNQGSRYQLNIPLLIGPEATLILSGTDARELRMNVTTGVFIVNAGHLWFHDITVAGWDPKANGYATLDFDSKRQFRPFIIAWGGSEMNADGSHFHHLGFGGDKGYGFSYSQGPVEIEEARPGALPHPTGTVVENSFEDLYFGFFTNGADGVALVGNEYKNNVVYGIDPHDYSNALIIAYNTSYGAIKKHGIIGSREVDNSWIVGNIVFENHGTGIMLDRASTGNVVYANRVWSNGHDGMAVYESACNILAANTSFGNAGTGVTVRNSTDVGVFRNTLKTLDNPAINIYVGDPRAVPGFPERDVQRDPYTKFVSVSVIGNTLDAGPGGGVSATGFGSVALRGNHVFGANAFLRGDVATLAPAVLRFETEGVVVRSTCPARPQPKTCPFRQSGYLGGLVEDLPAAEGPDGHCDGIADIDDEVGE